MMGRRSGGSFGIVLAIVLGLFAGILFFSRDARLGTPAPSSEVVVTPTSTAAPSSVAAQPVERPQSYQLLIPAAAIDAPILHVPFVEDAGSWDVHLLGTHAGHLRRTAWLDAPGNMVIIGHVELADGSPGPFAGLSTLTAGALIYIVDSANTPIRTYRVLETHTTPPTDISALYSTPDDRLTLITCGSYDFLSNSYVERVVTTAVRVL
ncbi:MAG: class F sortase [Anaerolineae bacterium]